MVMATQNQVQSPASSPQRVGRFHLRSQLRTPFFSYIDLDGKREGWVMRQAEGYFLGWERRRPNGSLKPMWYARFSRNLVPEYCLTVDTLKALPDKPVGEKVVE